MEEDELQEMAKRLRFVRKFVGLNQHTFGQRLGVKLAAVSNWENGRSRIGIGPCHQILMKFQISADFVLAGITNGLDQNTLEAWNKYEKQQSEDIL